MKGVIFNELEELVRIKLGDCAWDEVLDATPLKTGGGVFAGPKVYPDEDLVAILQTLSARTKLGIPELLVEFGRHLGPRLIGRYPGFVTPGMTAKQFLLTIHGTIHVEVRKLHPDAVPPHFEYEDVAPDRLTMRYRSSRKLCDLVVGLLAGVGDHFKERIALEQTLCTKRGDPYCRFELVFAR